MSKKGNILFWSLVLIVVMFAAYTVYSKNKTINDAMSKQAVKPTPKATDVLKDFTLKDKNGKNFKLSNYTNKVVVFNFFTTWCPYCIKEMPDLLDYFGDNKDSEDIKFAFINATKDEEDEDEVFKFIKDYEIDATVLMDTDGKAVKTFGIVGYPTTVIIGKDGKVAKIHQGPISRAQLEEYVSGLVSIKTESK